MNLACLLERAGRTFPDQPAVAHGQQILWTYRELAYRVSALGWALGNSLGLEAGDRVALFMRNSPEYLEMLFACWYAGLIVVPINAKLSAQELAYILDDSGARLCVVTTDLVDTVQDATRSATNVEHVVDASSDTYLGWTRGHSVDPALRDPDDPAWLFYTSGTTGTPKGAVLTHRNLLSMNSGYFTDVEPVNVGDAILHAAPLSHGSGLYVLPHVTGAALHVIPSSGGFDAGEVCELIDTYPGVSFFAAPTMVKRLTRYVREHGIDTSSIRTIVYGGGPMHFADLQEALATFGNRLAEIYGQGESPMTITAKSRTLHAICNTPDRQEQLASVGMPHSVVEVRIVSDDGKPLPTGEVGEIIVRGDSVMQGYWNNPDSTAKTLVDGWLYTGDRGCFDVNGLLYLKDRSKDVIISGGTNIYTKEVEDVLLTHPQVFEVSVVGRPDPEWGEVVVAFVVTTGHEQIAADDLDALCLRSIARFKRPKDYYFVRELPKNAYGKIVKNRLRERLAEATE